MGFPVGYTELFLPNILILTLSFLGFIRKLISFLLCFLGLSDFLEPEMNLPENNHHHNQNRVLDFHSVSAILIKEMLPVGKFSDLLDPPESCAVCLNEFEGDEEIRHLRNCWHIFHRSCLDHWMDCDQKTCPLCRTPFVPDELQESFNERLWAASGIPDFYGEYSAITDL